MTESQRFLELNTRVVAWAEAKGILAAGDELAQLGKTLEECREFLDAIRSGDVEQIKLEMGDVLVTCCVRMALNAWAWGYDVDELLEEPLSYYDVYDIEAVISEATALTKLATLLTSASNITAHYGFTVCDALQAAVEKIEKRTGKMVGGVFVKEAENENDLG